MPEICRFFGIIITMYADDHNPPHFHARHGDFKAMINIATGDIIEGSMPRKSLRLIQAWVEIHQNELMANWNEGQSENPNFTRIEPLRQEVTMNFVQEILKTEPYKLTIKFKNGEIKVVDLENKIKTKSTTPESKYKALLDYDYFKTVKLQEEWETIYWDNGLDFCPDVLYQLGTPLKKENHPNKNPVEQRMAV